MKEISLENFLKNYNIDIYDFMSYLDTTQHKPEKFVEWYKQNALPLKINTGDEKPIKIDKKFIKKNFKIIKLLYFNEVSVNEWIIKAFSFSNNILITNEYTWYDIHCAWKKLIDDSICTDIIVSVLEHEYQEKNLRKNKIKNLKI